MKNFKKIICTTFVLLITSASIVFSEDTIDVGEVVVTALRAEESVVRIPGNVTVITSEDIANSTATTVQDIIRDAEGVIVRDLYGTGTKTTVDVRGFTAGMNTAVLIDGRKLNEIDLSGVEWNMISLDNVERIEIIRSGGSVLYGDNANGAVVNIITKKGKSKSPSLKIDSSFGSYGEDREELSVNGATETTSYYFSARNTKTDGYRDNSEFRAEDFSGRVIKNFGSNSYIDFSAGTHRDHQGFPSTLNKAQVKADPTKATSLVDDANYDQYYYSITAGLSEGKTELDITYNLNNREYNSDIFGGTVDSDIDKKEIKLKLTVRDDLLGKRNLLVAGVDTFKATVDSASDIPPYFIDTTTDLEKDEKGFYLQNEIFLSKNIVALLGFRSSDADFNYNIEGTTTGSGRQSFGEEAYKAGLTFNYGKGSKIFIAQSKGYRLPATDESFSAFSGMVTNLKSEKNLTSEIGISHRATDSLTVAVTLYNMKVENEIFYNDLSWNNENIDDTIHEGVEISFSAKLGASTKLKGGWSYTDAKNDSGVHDGKDLPLVPKNSGSLELIVKPTGNLTVSIDANYIGQKRFGSDYANKAGKMEAYTVANGKIKYELGDRATFFVGADNLFNELYSETGYDYGFGPSFYPAPERRYYGGVSLVF